VGHRSQRCSSSNNQARKCKNTKTEQDKNLAIETCLNADQP
jgi:hypothetical protein